MKRWTIRICVLLLLGAIVNVTVAWGLALRVDMNAGTPGSALPPKPVAWPAYLAKANWPRPDSVAHTAHQYGSDVYGIEARTPKNLNILDPSISWACLYMCEVGWPARSMEYHSVSTGGPQMTELANKAILHMPMYYHGLGVFPGRPPLPMVFLPIGTVVNTLLYAAALWLVLVGSVTLSNHLRTKPGLCLKCGYDLRGSSEASTACPECGTPVKRTDAQAAA